MPHPKSTLVISTIGNVEKQRKKISHQKPTIPFLTFGAECLWNFNCYSLIIKESSAPCPHHRNLGRSFSYVLVWISNYLTWLFSLNAPTHVKTCRQHFHRLPISGRFRFFFSHSIPRRSMGKIWKFVLPWISWPATSKREEGLRCIPKSSATVPKRKVKTKKIVNETFLINLQIPGHLVLVVPIVKKRSGWNLRGCSPPRNEGGTLWMKGNSGRCLIWWDVDESEIGL